MYAGGVIAVYGSFLDVYTYMVFLFLDEHVQPFDEHAPCLHAALKLLLHFGCVKWTAFGEQGLISRLNGQQQILQPAVYLYRLTALASAATKERQRNETINPNNGSERLFCSANNLSLPIVAIIH